MRANLSKFWPEISDLLIFLAKWFVFEPPICGRRPPEHPIKFFGLIKCIFVQLMCWNYMRIYFLHTPGQFLSDTSDFSSFFGQWKFFWTAESSRRPAGGPTKIFDRSYTTFKHPYIILGWSDDPKGSLKKKFTPPKSIDFGGVKSFLVH